MTQKYFPFSCANATVNKRTASFTRSTKTTKSKSVAFRSFTMEKLGSIARLEEASSFVRLEGLRTTGATVFRRKKNTLRMTRLRLLLFMATQVSFENRRGFQILRIRSLPLSLFLQWKSVQRMHRRGYHREQPSKMVRHHFQLRQGQIIRFLRASLRPQQAQLQSGRKMEGDARIDK